MSRLKKVWINEGTLSLEYADPNTTPVAVNTTKFPYQPTEKNPLRMVTTVGHFSDEDLVLMHAALTKRLIEGGLLNG